MKLYAYWRSSASWRARIALGLKGVAFEYVPVNLAEREQRQETYRSVNAIGQVPTLVLDDGRHIAQSLAIIEYLEETIPQPPLLPRDPYLRAMTRQLAEIVNSGIQPLQNTSPLAAIEALGGSREEWAQRWITEGLDALARTAAPHMGQFLVGDTVTMADVCLVPQLYNARRFKLDAARWPSLTRVEEACMRLDAFVAAHPDRQPDKS
jgi:maleylpyruvate isomerase